MEEEEEATFAIRLQDLEGKFAKRKRLRIAFKKEMWLLLLLLLLLTMMMRRSCGWSAPLSQAATFLLRAFCESHVSRFIYRNLISPLKPTPFSSPPRCRCVQI